MKSVILSFAALILVIAAYVVYQNLSLPSAKIDGHSFKLLIAKTEKERQTGLSKYKSLPQDEAMVFIFDKSGNYSFWMKDMKFPIDIIFTNEGKIVTIYNNIPNPKNSSENLPIYSPTQSTNKVLEINAGLSKKYNFKVGEKVEFNNLQ